MIEEDGPHKLGGTCVNVGCVPKKLMVYGSHYAAELEESAGFGWRNARHDGVDWDVLMANKDAEIDRLNGIYERIVGGAGAELVRGHGTMTGPKAVAVAAADGSTRSLTADTVLVAVGGTPFRPPIPGAELGIVSNDCFYLKEQPKRIVVIGGGYIAVEFACIFAGYGSEVTLLYRGDLFLRGFDQDMRTHLKGEMEKKGIKLRFSADAASLEKGAAGEVVATLKDGEKIAADQVLFATGRTPNTEGLGLELAGVELGRKGEVVVDEYSKTSADGVYAIGDVTDRVQLTPVALYEAICFVDTVFSDRPTKPCHDDIASAVFSQPSIATVGVSEAKARETLGDERVSIFRSEFKPMKHQMTGKDHRSLMKLVVDKETDKVIGIHICGDDSSEMIQGFAVAVKCGATKAQFDATIGVHPSAAEELVTMRTPVEFMTFI